jgi:hypothetical protein
MDNEKLKLKRLSQQAAPHLADLAEALNTEFGGLQQLAKTLHNLVMDDRTPHWLKMRAYAIIVNVIDKTTKMNESDADENDLCTDADLVRKFRQLVTSD